MGKQAKNVQAKKIVVIVVKLDPRWRCNALIGIKFSKKSPSDVLNLYRNSNIEFKG